MRFLAACSAAILFAASAGAQTARVSGRVIEQGRGTPVAGATVRLTGASARVTDSLGYFQFLDVSPGRYIITVASIGYRFHSVELAVGGDTTLSIAMTRRVVSLDTMVVLPRYVRIRGTAVDSASGDYLLQAQATLYPGGKFIGARNGTFTFDSVPPGPITIIVEGGEYLPRRIEFEAIKDTTFRVKMGIDSVALRMIALQVRRLEKRSHSIPYTLRSFNRDIINEQRPMTIGEFVDRKLFRLPDPRNRAFASALANCVFVDDMRVDPAMLDGMVPELIERVELYQRGKMIRVYTRRYVASLIGKSSLKNVIYIPTGTRTTCA